MYLATIADFQPQAQITHAQVLFGDGKLDLVYFNELLPY
jgi:hypothetical protein